MAGTKNTIQFYKTVGGYASACKIRGRWYLISAGGTSYGPLLAFEQACEARGLKPVRVGKLPQPWRRAWNELGATANSLRQRLPMFDESLLDRSKQ